LYIEMEYLAGGGLAGRLQATPLDPHDAAEVLSQVACGLHYTHEQGMIHRDLKPHNVLLRPRAGAAEHGPLRDRFVGVLGDFGLARHREGESAHSLGNPQGTPSYMAPEQAQGGLPVDQRADVYGLGAVLYHCLTGRPPFAGPTLLE